MRLGTIRHDDSTRAVSVQGDHAVLLDFPDVGALLRTDDPTVEAAKDGERLDDTELHWAPLITTPNKIICVGLNYRDHIEEMGHIAPPHPTYFSKFSDALIGANDDIHLPDPSVSVKNDLEVELTIVIGKAGRNIAAADALDHIAGFTIMNDFSVRDWQKRTSQFLAGKTFEHCSPLGPIMVTTDEIGDGSGLHIESAVNGVVKQSSNTDHLVFNPADLIADISKAITLLPGDIIATGTPGGVGAARTPPEWLADGDEIVMTIEGIGELRNRCVQAS